MKKYIMFGFLLILMFVFTGCGEKNKDTEDDTSEHLVVNERYPSFVVETINASKGEEDVVVRVSLKDNPGFLTMAMNITYDSNSMLLTKVVSGQDYSEYNFVGPRNKKSGCLASWFVPEIPEKIIDGEILELHFNISEQVESGSYPITISRPDNGGIVDENKNAIIFNNAIGYIKIK